MSAERKLERIRELLNHLEKEIHEARAILKGARVRCSEACA